MMATLRTFALLGVSLMVTACRPTYEDWSRESRAVFQGYVTGDVHTAKAALLTEERLLAQHEARGNRGVDGRGVRSVLYTELCGLAAQIGETNEARLHLQKYLENTPERTRTLEDLIEAARKGDERLKPKWREQ